ncbi:hypothetical protein EVAR_7864_1 [Eumeta japonica]|uniref:Uncharacterized protein n=1 Tax=Eumeta variegata TaxID=151549 RepID=A0A4C1TV10_EUMVA|nr:hypothetical protein EVAR_7864_1 [Eumeta japonica]
MKSGILTGRLRANIVSRQASGRVVNGDFRNRKWPDLYGTLCASRPSTPRAEHFVYDVRVYAPGAPVRAYRARRGRRRLLPTLLLLNEFTDSECETSDRQSADNSSPTPELTDGPLSPVLRAASRRAAARARAPSTIERVPLRAGPRAGAGLIKVIRARCEADPGWRSYAAEFY